MVCVPSCLLCLSQSQPGGLSFTCLFLFVCCRQDQDPSTAPKLMAVQEFIAAHSQCSANSSTGNNTFSSNPDAGGSCEAGCSDHGECVDGSCACFTGYSGPACNITSYTDKYDCGYKCTFDQVGYRQRCTPARLLLWRHTLCCTAVFVSQTSGSPAAAVLQPEAHAAQSVTQQTRHLMSQYTNVDRSLCAYIANLAGGGGAPQPDCWH